MMNEYNLCLSDESYHKLNRANKIAFSMNLCIQLLQKKEMNLSPLLWFPEVLSYISDDITSVLEEVKKNKLKQNQESHSGHILFGCE